MDRAFNMYGSLLCLSVRYVLLMVRIRVVAILDRVYPLRHTMITNRVRMSCRVQLCLNRLQGKKYSVFNVSCLSVYKWIVY